MRLNLAIYLPRKKTSLIVALGLFLILCGIGIKVGQNEKEMVLAYAVSNKIIVVDAGHGGADPGAVRGSMREKDITLPVARKLAEYLSQAGAMVIMLRNDDADLAGDGFKGSIAERKRQDLSNRVKKANQANADLYISIHTNAEISPQWSGAQTFYNTSSEKSQQIAESIQQELKTRLGNTKREAKTGSYFVINRVRMPAVIVEVGFLSNPGEARLLNDKEYQAKVAYAIFSGIVKAQAAQVPSGSDQVWRCMP